MDVKTLIIAGGVAANQGLRKALKESVTRDLSPVKLVTPSLDLCGDNAAMIGIAGFILANQGHFAKWNLNANSSLSL
jgi:N6-L-threonylcarbamoyladenine synthase